VAQVAGLGVIVADALGWEPAGAAVQVVAVGAALACALLLTWTERRWPEVQEAVIGTVFVLAASAAVLVLAKNPHGGEHLKDLLLGQILWVGPTQLAIAGIATALLLALWFGPGARLGRAGFYAVFACAVTVSVQLVGLYLVFITLVVPALSTWYARSRRLLSGYAIASLGYALGLGASIGLDLPSGAVIVCAMALVGAAFAVIRKAF
jgi:zinc/manganese transport system permease protein